MSFATQTPRDGTEGDYCYLYVKPPGHNIIPFGFPILIRDADKAVRKLRKIRAFDFLDIDTLELEAGARHTEEREIDLHRREAEWNADAENRKVKAEKKSKSKRKAVAK